jgi:hypothetical protein
MRIPRLRWALVAIVAAALGVAAGVFALMQDAAL